MHFICRGGWFLDGATGPAPPLESFAPIKHWAREAFWTKRWFFSDKKGHTHQNQQQAQCVQQQPFFNTHTAAYRNSLAYQNQKAMFLNTSTLDSDNASNENYKSLLSKTVVAFRIFNKQLKELSFNCKIAFQLWNYRRRIGIQSHFKILQTLQNVLQQCSI